MLGRELPNIALPFCIAQSPLMVVQRCAEAVSQFETFSFAATIF
jgi:hypothetical protein